MSMREAFEKWAVSQRLKITKVADGSYTALGTAHAWWGYQAAIADVKAGGPDARVALTHGSLVGILEYRINAGTPLYKLPEET